VASEFNLQPGTKPTKPLAATSLHMPRLVHHDSMTVAIPRKIYQNAHTYHIHSLSVNSDGETFLSADDLRINLWNFNVSDQSFSTFTIFNHDRHCGY
jgi:serine/threonine-protein phosphatase 2A regulatory subunit B